MNSRPDILTASGHYFNFLTPEENVIDIADIAHGLSHVCRFAGQCKVFYSVAQHSVLVSGLVPPSMALHALLHDAAEAYIGDVTRPLKALLPEYKAIERRIEQAIFAAFDLPISMPPEIKRADMILLNSEQQDLMPHHDDQWPCVDGVGRLPFRIVPLAPKEARALFLKRYEQLVGYAFIPASDSTVETHRKNCHAV